MSELRETLNVGNIIVTKTAFIEGYRMAGFKVHGGDFGSGQGLLMFGQLSLPRQTVPLSKLVSIAIANQESQKKLLGTAAMGAAGLLVLGPLGAIGGMLLGGNKTNVTFVGTLDDGQSFVATCDAKLFSKLQGHAATAASARAKIVNTESKSLDQAPAPVTLDNVYGYMSRMFVAMDWTVTELPKGLGSRFSILHAATAGRSISLGVHTAALDGYNLGLMVRASEAFDSGALIVAVGRTLSSDAKRAARESKISIGVYADTHDLVDAALVGRAEIKS